MTPNDSSAGHLESEPPTSGLRPGEIVGERFRLASVIGSGASGVVYLAHTLDTASPVALKVVHRELCGDRQIFGRYRREAAILRRLSGPHIVEIRDFIEHDGLLIIALEFVDGTSLETLVENKVSVAQAIEIAAQIAEGLVGAHEAGVIHRDLKPANVIIQPRDWPRSGDLPRVRILDFGLAKVLHGEHMTTGLTEHDMIFGTPEYMAPEQARGDELDERCDVYAVGAMLYEMTTGVVPFVKRTPLATMTAHLSEPVPPPRASAPEREISPALETVILRALEKERESRYASAAELARAVRAAAEKRFVSSGAAPGDTAAAISRTDIELGETDLAIRVSQVSPERRASIESKPPSMTSRPTPPPARTGLTLWTLVIVVAGLAAIAIGVLLALR